MLYVLLDFYIHAKFELDSCIFGKVMANILLKIDDVKYSNYFFLAMRTTYTKTKTTIGFPDDELMSCIESKPL